MRNFFGIFVLFKSMCKKRQSSYLYLLFWTGSQQYEKALGHLMSRDPRQFWTSGQWMTEKKGGSDVANGTQTIAVHIEGNR